MSSTSKRKEIMITPVLPKKKLSRCVRYNKNKKLKWALAEKTEPEESIPLSAASSTELDIIFNPSKVFILFLLSFTEINF